MVTRARAHEEEWDDEACYITAEEPHLAKLDDRSTKMVLLGYEPGSTAYHVYDPASNRVHVTRDVMFDEGAQWDWENTGGVSDGAPFHVEFSYPIGSSAVKT